MILKNMNLYLRYVDDEYVICEIISVELWTKTGRENNEKTSRNRNEIHPSIQVTINFPSNNPNGRMPALDTEHWIEEAIIKGVKKQQVTLSHYSKQMANAFVTHKD